MGLIAVSGKVVGCWTLFPRFLHKKNDLLLLNHEIRLVNTGSNSKHDLDSSTLEAVADDNSNDYKNTNNLQFVKSHWTGLPGKPLMIKRRRVKHKTRLHVCAS